jgi:hypothetical protein
MASQSPISRLKEAVAAETARSTRVLASIEDQELNLTAEQEAFTQSRGLKPVQWPDTIKIDVGGKKCAPFCFVLFLNFLTPCRFFSTVATLKSKPGVLRAVCDGVGNIQLDSKGYLFIDRSPDAFRFILAHLRGSSLRSDVMTQAEREMLVLDASFYELDELSYELGASRPSQQSLSVTVEPSQEENPLLAPYIQAALKHLAQRKAEWSAERAAALRIEAKILSFIGGRKVKLQFEEKECRFSTSTTTLAKLNDKFGDNVFIPRNGQTFGFVLNVLRGYYSIPTHLTPEQRHSFLNDMTFFGLQIPTPTVAAPPKRPMSAYLFYRGKGAACGDWKTLSEAERRPYVERAAEDKLRYEREKKEWDEK